MKNNQEKVAKWNDADEELLPLSAEELAELEKRRQDAVAQDAERVRAYRDRVRGLAAPTEIAGD